LRQAAIAEYQSADSDLLRFVHRQANSRASICDMKFNETGADAWQQLLIRFPDS